VAIVVRTEQKRMHYGKIVCINISPC